MYGTDSTIKKVIADIFKKINLTIESIVPVVGHGSVNRIFIISTDVKKLVIRLNHDRGFDEFVKEKWCIEQSAAKGVLGPEVLAVGEIGGYSYMVQSFLEGIVGSEGKMNTVVVWEEIGRYAKLIHSIPVYGFGLHSAAFMDATGENSTDSWRKFLAYNIESLVPEDTLIKRGALDAAQSQKVKRLFQELSQKKFSFGLNHGDLSLKNVIVTPQNTVSIFDWGSAEAHIVPHHDFGEILKSSLTSNSSEFTAFLKGYGLSDAEYKAIEKDVHTLMLLRAIDKLRWAIDKHPIDIPRFTKEVQKRIQVTL